MERTKRLVNAIKFAPYNANRMKKNVFEKLKESIRKFKVYSPLIVNTRTDQVVGGNQRLRAAILAQPNPLNRNGAHQNVVLLVVGKMLVLNPTEIGKTNSGSFCLPTLAFKR